jgi:hypothetical protein
MIRATKRFSIAGRVLAGATVAAAVLVPAATANAVGTAEPGVKAPTVAQGYVQQWGPYYLFSDCQFDRGMAIGSGTYSYVSNCDRNPTLGTWWLVTETR